MQNISLAEIKPIKLGILGFEKYNLHSLASVKMFINSEKKNRIIIHVESPYLFCVTNIWQAYDNRDMAL